MVLIVLFFKQALKAEHYQSAKDLLMLAVGIVLIALSLMMAHSGHGHNPFKKQKKQEENK